MEIILNILAFFAAVWSAIALISTVVFLARWLFSRGENRPNLKKKFFISTIVFVTAIIVFFGSIFYLMNLMDSEASRLGFKNTAEYTKAKNAGISDPEELRKIAKNPRSLDKLIADQKSRKKEEEARIKAEAEAKANAEAESRLKAERAKAEAQREAERDEQDKCRKDLACWGEKATIIGGFRCKPYIEKLAKFDFEWTDGILEQKFSHYRWKDSKIGLVTLLGDKIKMQNGFGAWVRMSYECDINPTGEVVLDVRIRQGRL